MCSRPDGGLPTSTIVFPRLSSRRFALKDFKSAARLHVAFDHEIQPIKKRGRRLQLRLPAWLRSECFYGFAGRGLREVEPQHAPELVQCSTKLCQVFSIAIAQRASTRRCIRQRESGADLLLKLLELCSQTSDFVTHTVHRRSGSVHELIQDSLLVS